MLAGCSSSRERHAVDWVITLPPGSQVAVAPPINMSGSGGLDTLKVGDLMASELSTLPGIGVIGVNRVLAVLAEQGAERVQSPEHAAILCERLGADAIVVVAVTEYNPYTPVVGMVAEMYGRTPAGPPLDPVATSRATRPGPMPRTAEMIRPMAQVQRTFNAEHKAIQEEVEQYAESRDGNSSPYEWRKYLVSQENYLRYCCHEVACGLMQ